jgi:hypothetical protein
VEVRIEVAGPNGWGRQLKGSARFNGVAPGCYAVTARRARLVGAVSERTWSPMVDRSPVCLEAEGEGAVTVSFEADPGSGKLWLAEFDNWEAAVAFDAEELMRGGRGTPIVGWGLRDGANVRALAFDAAGDLWIAGRNELVAYDRRALGAPGGAPKIRLTGPAFVDVGSVAFDREGALWIARFAPGSVIKLPAAALAASGEPVPAVELQGPDLAEARALAFDRDGNLWVAGADGAGIVMYRAQRLGESTDRPADLRLPRTRAPLAFDPDGNLWTRGYGVGLVRFRPEEAAAGGPPSVVIDLSTAHALAFDERGGAWIQPSAGRLGYLPPEDLRTSGPKSPRIVHDRSYLETDSLAFNPPPSFMPVAQR